MYYVEVWLEDEDRVSFMKAKRLHSSMHYCNPSQLIVKPEHEQAIVDVIVWPTAMEGRIEA